MYSKCIHRIAYEEHLRCTYDKNGYPFCTYVRMYMYVPMYLIYAHMYIWMGYIRTYVYVM